MFASPLEPEGVLGRVREWLEQPTSVVVQPTPRHLDVVSGLLEATGAGGNLTSDAHLAAPAIEHRAKVITYDSDFARFQRISWELPDPEALRSNHASSR